MNFATSTHKHNWIFSKTALHDIRQKLHDRSIEAVNQSKKAHTSTEDAKPRDTAPVTLDEERKLLRFFQGQIVNVCHELQYPRKVRATAIMYFKRFYLNYSCMDYEPRKVMLTCIYLAGKIEESYIAADDFCRALKQEPSTVLRMEVTLLQGLKFDLVVHSPYRALQGFMQDIQDCRAQGSASGVDSGLLGASDEALKEARQASTSALDALLMSDAPLTYPPGQLALAALRNGFRAKGIQLQQYLQRAAAAALQAAPGAPLETEQALQQLLQSLDEIDQLGMEGAQKVEVKEVAEVDKKLKAWRNPLLDPASDAYKQAVAASDKDKAEKREAKLRARKEQQAAAEAKLLGHPTPPPAAAPLVPANAGGA